MLVLGGSTVAAMGVGLIYGRGKRVWCRHLCPVSGVFSLFARLAPVHFGVDRKTWDTTTAFLLQDNAPRWMLTHYPEVNDVFTWLDGLSILFYIGATALVLGSWITLWLHLGGKMLPGRPRQNARWLSYALIPLGGLGVFLGLSSLTVTLLKAEGLAMPWLPQARGTLLALGVLWSLWLGTRMLRNLEPRLLIARQLAVLGMLAPWRSQAQ